MNKHIPGHIPFSSHAMHPDIHKGGSIPDKEFPLDSGGSLAIGGSVGTGGSLAMGGEFDGSHKDMYHHVLTMSPHRLEMKREIAAQLLGGVPSPMWGNLIEGENKALEAPASEYENIIRMPNQHAMARMLEATHNDASGEGFFNALKHVGRIAAKAYKTGRLAAIGINQFKDPAISYLGLDPYRSQIDSVINTISQADKILNPMADAALYATAAQKAQAIKQAKVHLTDATKSYADEIKIRR